MARAIWKGAISFGLVHIPVALVSATSSDAVDFDWLDSRSMEPVGYKRINKVTGEEVSKEHIVKGIEYEKDQYVILSEEEIRTAHPKSTQTIDIFAFVDREEIPLPHIDTPYYLAPDRRGEKVYALLRETLESTGKMALANVILHTRQHLAALMPLDSALVLLLLRWPSEVRSLSQLELNEATISPQLSNGEKEMARKLVDDMTASWQPDDYHNSFKEKIMQLVDKKVREGKVENVEGVEVETQRKSADIIDLTELLKRSLGNLKSTAATSSKSATRHGAEPALLKPKKASDKSKTKDKTETTKVDKPTKTRKTSRAGAAKK